MDLLKTQRYTEPVQTSPKRVQYYSQHEDPVDKLREHVKVTVNDGLKLCKVLINDPWTNVQKTLENTKEITKKLESDSKARFNAIKFYKSIGIKDPETFHKELIQHSLNVTTQIYKKFSLEKNVLTEDKFDNFIEKHLKEFHNDQRFDSSIQDQPVGKAQLLPPIRPPVVNHAEDKKVAKSAPSPVQQKPMLRKIVEQPTVQSSMPALKPIKAEMPELRVANDMPKLKPIVQEETQDDELTLVDEDIAGPKDWYNAARKDRAKRKQEKYQEQEKKYEEKQKEKKSMKTEWPGVDLVQYPKPAQQTAPVSPTVTTPAVAAYDKAVSWLREAVQTKKIELKEGASYVLFAPSNEILTQLENYYSIGKGVGRELRKESVIKHHLAPGVHQDSQFTTLSGLAVQKDRTSITSPTQTPILFGEKNTLKRLAVGTSYVTLLTHTTLFPK